MLKAIIDLKQIYMNVIQIKNDSQKELIVVSKSDSYNAGAVKVTNYLASKGIKYFAVVDAKEARQLVDSNLSADIIILNSIEDSDLPFVNENDNIILSVNSLSDAHMLKGFSFRRQVSLHIQIDTGMNRIGLKTISETQEVLDVMSQNKTLIIDGLYTHFTSLENLVNQENRFKKFLNLYPFRMIHAGASPTYRKTSIGNFVRVGLDVYGDSHANQAISFVTKPIAINKIKAGDSVGYNEGYQALKDETIAVLPVGYHDGYRRGMQGANVWAAGKLYTVVGIVCMNHLFVRVDDDVKMDTQFFLTCKENPAMILKEHINTISYEIFCMMKISERDYV